MSDRRPGVVRNGSEVVTAPRSQIGLWPALAANVLNMVGVGPFLTIPLVLSAMGGPQALLAWTLGAFFSLCDGLVWAEFGACLPDAGGSYTYFRKAFGEARWGRLMSFLFLGQTVVAGPLFAASGAVGLAAYTRYLIPALTSNEAKILAVSVCVLATVLLCRDIHDIGAISLLLTLVVTGTIILIIGAGASHFDAHKAFAFPPDAFHLSGPFWLGLGAGTLIAMYDYSGYFNVCLLGSEVRNPARNIPRCILISICFLAVCYCLMNISILSVVPWREAAQSVAIVSLFTERLYGSGVARMVTGLILLAAFGSLYANLLGYSRVPYAAALDGQFFAVFGKLHSRRNYPVVSVLTMGAMSAVLCLLPLEALITALLDIQIVTQFLSQCAALIVLRRYRREFSRPFRMPWYPVPVAIAFCGWLAIFVASGWAYMAVALGFLLLMAALFLLRARHQRNWPFAELSEARN